MERGVPGRNYFLAGPVHTLVESVELAAATVGRRSSPITVAPVLMRSMAVLAQLVEAVVPLPPDYTSDNLRELAGTTYIGTNRRAREELGWSVRSLREGWPPVVRHELEQL
jgi:nucleoside-diphosphate-sugar epimerase